MRSPLDIMLDRVDWKCVTCGISATVGCDCDETKKARGIEREYQRLMKLSDADLIAECERLGVKVDRN